jgi:transcriptional regulator with XRE-family HTH domain
MWQSGIHQNRLAREIDIDETLLSRIVNGYREPSAETRSRIAQFFNVDEEWLFASCAPSAAQRVRK